VLASPHWRRLAISEDPVEEKRFYRQLANNGLTNGTPALNNPLRKWVQGHRENRTVDDPDGELHMNRWYFRRSGVVEPPEPEGDCTTTWPRFNEKNTESPFSSILGHPRSSMKGRGRSSPLLSLVFVDFRRVVGRGVCGVGGQGWPEVTPEGLGLDADAVRVMLLMPETKKGVAGRPSLWGWARVRSGWGWSRFTRFRPVTGGRTEGSVAGHRFAVGAWCAATVTGWGQSEGRPRHPGVGVRPGATTHPVTSEPAHAACWRPGARARMCPSRRP
jgi:hypothetical protein